jgi:hypothetical protein
MVKLSVLLLLAASLVSFAQAQELPKLPEAALKTSYADAPGLFMLFGRADVQRELKVNDELLQAYEEIKAKAQAKIDEDTTVELTELQMQIKLNNLAEPEFMNQLSETQRARLKGLFVQYCGSSAVMDPIIGKEIGLADAQMEKIQGLSNDVFNKLQERTESDIPGLNELLARQIDKLRSSIDNVLTEPQRAKLKAMEGAKFKFERE